MRRALVLLTAALLIAVMAAPTQASPGASFELTKVCPSAVEPAWNACDIIDAAAPFEALEGGMVVYHDRFFGETPAGVFEIARVDVMTADRSIVATGQVRWLKDHGLYTFKGTDALPGFHATGRVEFVSGPDEGPWVYELTGTYHIDPAG